jgi:hypothetical protein
LSTNTQSRRKKIDDAALAFADRLDAKMAALLAEIEQSEVARLMADPASDPRLVATIIKYVMLEVFSYGPHVTEATFTAIGRLPKNRPDLMKRMISHDLSEVDHGEMALRDFIKLGGDEAWARSRRMTPASFAMAATCRMLGERENPFSYLGYMYLFEAMTPVLAERTQAFLKAHGFPTDAQVFIDVHAKEDIGHASLMRDLLVQVATDFPDAMPAIEHGFDCFAAVYPLPIWRSAVEHARREVQAHGR